MGNKDSVTANVMIGKILSGRYEIVKHLGSGGFSDTYLAQDRLLPPAPRCVVKRLKVQSKDPFAVDAARRLFDNEAATLHSLGAHSEHIPRLLAHFEDHQEFYLVQEFVDGQDLSHELLPGTQFDQPYTIALITDLLQILSYVHQQEVIHRDIKPRNLVRRSEDGNLFLIDFGAVKQITSQFTPLDSEKQTSFSIVIGTPGYMPNEQQGGKPRFSSDIYAAGMIAIQALTGLHPGQLNEDPQTGEMMWRDQIQVSPELAAILDKMIRSHFRDRYRSAEEVLQDLRRLSSASASTTSASTLKQLDPTTQLSPPSCKDIPTQVSLPPTPVPLNLHQGNSQNLSHQNAEAYPDIPLPIVSIQPPPTVPTAPAKPIVYRNLWRQSRRPWLAIGAAVALSLGSYGYWQEYSTATNRPTLSNSAISTSFKLANTLTVHTGAVFSIAFSPNGQYFASGSGDKTIKLWDASSGELLHTFYGHAKEVAAVAFTPDSKTLVSGGRDHLIKVWDVNSKQLLRTLPGHTDWVRSLAISPDGKTLVSGGKDHKVMVWNLETGELLRTLTRHTNEIESVAITSDSQTLVSGSQDQTIKIWDLKTGELIRTIAGIGEEVEFLALTPDGTKIVAGGEARAFIWELATGDLIKTLPEESGIMRSVSISPNGQTIVGSYEDNTVKLWDIKSGTLVKTLSGHTDWVLSASISPDGKTLISGARDKTVKIWKAF